MKSMTGFGFSSGGDRACQIEVTVKSSNARFTDIKVSSPFFYLPMERELKSLILNTKARGSWFVKIHRFPDKLPSKFVISWDKKQAQKWKSLYKTLSKDMGVRDNLTSSELATCSGVVNSVEKQQACSLAEKKKLKTIFKQALQACLKEKKREGLKLRADMLKHLQLLQNLPDKVSRLNEKCIKNLKRRYKSSEGKDVLDKIDIHEEVIRTKTHLKNFKKLLYGQQSVGKKLDFYTQEILRELNTIGSKSQDAQVTSLIVDGKFVLEKIREQVQNLE